MDSGSGAGMTKRKGYEMTKRGIMEKEGVGIM
jgi:hypothetical protein